MTTKPVLGISGCLTGSAVRFDGGHKRMSFVMDELAQWVNFRPVCPEMAIGLPTPRPALRLIMTTSGETQMRFSHAPHEDVTQKMADFTADFCRKSAISPGLSSALNPQAAAWNACGCMMKTATGAARRGSGCSPPPSLKPGRGCPLKRTDACTIRCCVKTLSNVFCPARTERAA